MLTLLKIFYLVLVYCHLPPLQDDIWFVLCWQRMIIFHWNLFIRWGGTIADSSCTMRMPDSHEFKSKMGGTKGTESHSAAVHGCSHCAYLVHTSAVPAMHHDFLRRGKPHVLRKLLHTSVDASRTLGISCEFKRRRFVWPAFNKLCVEHRSQDLRSCAYYLVPNKLTSPNKLLLEWRSSDRKRNLFK